MPLSEQGRKALAAMLKTYGAKKGKQVFYAMEQQHKGFVMPKAKAKGA